MTKYDALEILAEIARAANKPLERIKAIEETARLLGWDTVPEKTGGDVINTGPVSINFASEDQCLEDCSVS